MCLITTQSQPCVAKHDIVCYKTLTEDLVSPCYDHQYVLGEKIKSVLDNSHGMVTKGLHTFATFKQAYYEAKYTKWQNQRNSQLGVYAPIVVKCIIPQGSRYYNSPFGLEFASNQLIPLEIIYDKNHLLPLKNDTTENIQN